MTEPKTQRSATRQGCQGYHTFGFRGNSVLHCIVRLTTRRFPKFHSCISALVEIGINLLKIVTCYRFSNLCRSASSLAWFWNKVRRPIQNLSQRTTLHRPIWLRFPPPLWFSTSMASPLKHVFRFIAALRSSSSELFASGELYWKQ